MKKRKGQSVVEFALVLPLFLFILFGIIYSGMMFHDYAALSNIARASAREAAVSDTIDYTNIKSYYTPQLSYLLTSFYKPAGSDPISIVQIHDNEKNRDIIKSTIIMQLSVDGFFVDMIFPKTFGVEYHMQKEPYTN